MRIVLVHGYNSSVQDNFWPWLSDSLNDRGHEVISVSLPNPSEPNCEAWVKAIDESISQPGGDTIFISHSLGGVALLHYLEEAEMSGTPKSVILISTPFNIGSERFESFFIPPIDFDTVMWRGQEFVLIHANDDDVIPIDHSKRYEKELNGKLHILESGKHFVDSKELPILLKIIDQRDVEPGAELNDDFKEIEAL